jgi:hypothetical protein
VGAVQEDIGVPRNAAATGVVQGIIRYDDKLKQYVPVTPNGARGDNAQAAAANKELAEGKAQPYTKEHAKQFQFNIKNAQAKNKLLDSTGDTLSKQIAPLAARRPVLKSELEKTTAELEAITQQGNELIAAGQLGGFKGGIFLPSKTDGMIFSGSTTPAATPKKKGGFFDWSGAKEQVVEAKKEAISQQLTKKYADANKRLTALEDELEKQDAEMAKAQKIAKDSGYMISAEDGRVYDPRRNKQFKFSQPTAMNPSQDYGGAGAAEPVALTADSPQADFDAAAGVGQPRQPYVPGSAVAEANRNFILSQNAKRDTSDRIARSAEASRQFGINPQMDDRGELLRMEARKRFPQLSDSAIDQVVINMHNEEMAGIAKIMRDQNVSKELADEIYQKQLQAKKQRAEFSFR